MRKAHALTMIQKLFISLVVANAAAFIIAIDAAPFQWQPKSPAEVQQDPSRAHGAAQLISYLFKILLSAMRKSNETGKPFPWKEILPPFVNTLGNFISLMHDEFDPHDPAAAITEAFKQLLLEAMMGGRQAKRELSPQALKSIGNFFSFLFKNINSDSEIQEDHVRIPRIRLHGFSNKERQNSPKEQ